MGLQLVKKANLLLVFLTTVAAFAQGQIIFSNRNIPTSSGTGTYNVPIWEAGGTGSNAAGDLPGGVTVGLFTPAGQMIGSSRLRTDAAPSINSGFFATAAQTLTVPFAEPGTTANLLIRVWQGTGGYDAARFSGLLSDEMPFTTRPLGGTNSAGVVFPTPGMTGWGPETGAGWTPCWDCAYFPPPVPAEVAVTLKPGFNLVANPLNASDNSIGSLFKKMDGGVPAGTAIYRLVNGNYAAVIWDDLENKFTPDALAAEGTFPGGGVLVWLPGSSEKVLRFVGTRPGLLCVSIQPGFSILSNGAFQPAPPEILPAVLKPASRGDMLFRYNPVTKTYTAHAYDDLDNKFAPDIPPIPPGEAYLYYRAGAALQSCTTYQ